MTGISSPIVFSTEHESANTDDATDKAKQYYKSCINQGSNLLGSDAKWRFCLNETVTYLRYATWALFIQEASFTPEIIQVVQNMIEDVRTAFIDNLENLSWLDADTRYLIQLKTNAIKSRVGYPEIVTNKTLLNNEYEALQLSELDYLGNFGKILHFHKNYVNETKWYSTPSTVNSWHTYEMNEIEIPAGTLRKPFFHPSFPKYVNYGIIGFLIGHEISHGFDTKGKKDSVITFVMIFCCKYVRIVNFRQN